VAAAHRRSRESLSLDLSGQDSCTNAPKSGLTAQTDGIVGVRINHVLDVQVDGFQVQQQ
jgi:hypothetical protein